MDAAAHYRDLLASHYSWMLGGDIEQVERLVSLGARRVDWDLYPDDADFVVLADPEGNRFCLIDTGHS